MKSIKHPFDAAVVAQTHSPLYLMHRYWARKPPNVVSQYIEYYTNPGDIVLDPFMGSGVSVIEAARLGRNAIGIDLNPIACFIAHTTLLPVNLDQLETAIEDIERSVKDRIDSYYKVRCSRCQKEAIATHLVWKTERFKRENIFLLKISCPYCKKSEQRKPIDDDLQRYEEILDENIPFFYPIDVRLHATAKRSVEFIHELFTHRALICLSILLDAIKRLTICKDELLLAFTSTLAQVSRMPPYAASSGISWKVPNYWIPPLHWEQHVWNAFKERTKKLIKGRKEAAKFVNGQMNYTVTKGDATDLHHIPSDSVDYIFTDPPYGDAVPYLGLSLMWAAWLGLEEELNFDREILIPERGDYEQQLKEYRTRLNLAFQEMFRVLKSKGTLTVTFHNREIRVWNALVSAAFDAGFLYEIDNYVLPAVKSSKAQLAQSGSMTGDIYINFRKPQKVKTQKHFSFEHVIEILTEEAKMIIQSRNGQATTDQLARGIYSHLIKENLFKELPSADIRKVLASLPIDEVLPNVWALRESEGEAMLAYIPLHKRIEFIIYSVLEGSKKSGFVLDDFLIPIFTQLKNGLTPESKEIIDVLMKCAQVRRDKWYPLPRQMALIPEYELPQKVKPNEEELREHDQFIYQLAQLGSTLGNQIWVGKNEQNKSKLLQKMSIRELEIPGLNEKAISKNRINQIDLIWLNPDEGRYVAFEIENSTGVVPGIQRLANLTEKLPHLRIPSYVVIPDKFRGRANAILNSPSGRALGDDSRKIVVYSKLLHHIDLLKRKIIQPAALLDSIAEPANLIQH
ncbi:MAG TPA: DNA methyltransferase [Pyrinomonadaceae bacterium]|nr:DNA methyltransferase [Pyrinomonadaceae bacterium]